MYIQVVYLEVKAEQRHALLAEAKLNVQASRQENGVIQFDLLQKADNPDKLMLFEAYQTEADAEAHRHTAHFRRWLEAGVPLLSGERVREVYRKIEVD